MVNKMVVINGRVFQGNNVSIAGEKIIIDGKAQSTSYYDEKEIIIVINGNAENVSCEVGNITVQGYVSKNVKNTNGNIEIGGDVGGDVKNTNGSISCGNVAGDIDTTNGSVNHRR